MQGSLVELAHRNAKRMMPFIIEECRLEDDFEYYLANVQYYRAYIDAEKEMIKMISDIKEYLGMSKEDIQKTDRELEKKKRQRRKKAKKRRYFKIKIGILVVLLLLVYKFMYLTIAGERVGRFDGYIQLSDEELTQRDWRKIKKLKKLTVIEIVNCKLPDENIGEICNEQVWFLRLENCGISDKHIQTIDFENMQRLNALDISGNPDITELSALGDQVENLIQLDISNTSITDLGFLENAQKLQRLHADNTGVADLSGLSDCYELKEISLDTNKLMNFEGLEKCLKLSAISAKDNQITSLKGLENTTQIREFVLDNNQLDDLSVLKKSQKTLEAVSVNNNKLKDLTEIHEAALLKVLFADENQLQNLSDLSDLTFLEKVSVQGNEIESIAGIENCINLREIDLSDNQISECSELGEMMLNHSLILDLSENNLRDLTLPFVTQFEYLSLNGNPLRNIDVLYGKSVHRCDLTFSALVEYPKLSENIDYLYIVGCPLDRRLELEDVFSGGRIEFVTEIDMSDGLSGNVNTTMETS